MEITVARGDAYASILRVKYMLESQYAEICPLKGTVIGMHWNACIDRLKQARKFPGLAVEVTVGLPLLLAACQRGKERDREPTRTKVICTLF